MKKILLLLLLITGIGMYPVKSQIKLKTIDVVSYSSISQFNFYFTEKYGFDEKIVCATRNANPAYLNTPVYYPSYEEAYNNYKIEMMNYRFQYRYIENSSIPLDPRRWYLSK